MCKSKVYNVDLFMNTSLGGITWDVQTYMPQMINKPLKIVVKQISMEFKESPDDNSVLVYYRIVHNLNILGACNLFNNNNNSTVLSLIDMYSVRTSVSTTIGGDINKIGSFSPNNILICPNGLPSIMTLQRFGAPNDTGVDARQDNPLLSWMVKLEITILEPEDLY